MATPMRLSMQLAGRAWPRGARSGAVRSRDISTCMPMQKQVAFAFELVQAAWQRSSIQRRCADAVQSAASMAFSKQARLSCLQP